MIEDDGLKAMGQVIQMKPGSGINFGEMVRGTVEETLAEC
jgi:hypothetical protein